jgi:hypothetical protein
MSDYESGSLSFIIILVLKRRVLNGNNKWLVDGEINTSVLGFRKTNPK